MWCVRCLRGWVWCVVCEVSTGLGVVCVVSRGWGVGWLVWGCGGVVGWWGGGVVGCGSMDTQIWMDVDGCVVSVDGVGL